MSKFSFLRLAPDPNQGPAHNGRSESSPLRPESKNFCFSFSALSDAAVCTSGAFLFSGLTARERRTPNAAGMAASAKGDPVPALREFVNSF